LTGSPILISALLLAADDAAGIVGLTTLSPHAGFRPDVLLSETDRRALLEGRGRWSARRLLAAGARGQIEQLSRKERKGIRHLLPERNASAVVALIL